MPIRTAEVKSKMPAVLHCICILYYYVYFFRAYLGTAGLTREV